MSVAECKNHDGVKCENCVLVRDLRWEVASRKSLHARALQRESSWREKARELEQRTRLQEVRIRELAQQHEALKAKLALMHQQLFGSKTERTKDGAPTGDGENKENSNAAGGAGGDCSGQRRNRGKQPGAKGHGRKPRTRLPSEEILHDLPEDAKCCPRCGKPFDPFPGTEDSDEIHWDVRFVRRVHQRKRYLPTCPCKAVAGIVTAPRHPKLIRKGMFSCGFWVEVLLNKYLHGMPLCRIIKTLAMEKLSVSPGTLTGSLKQIGELIQPLYAAILERCRAAAHWHMDETRWMVFAELAGKVGHRWWLWVAVTADTCVYLLDPTRSSAVPKNLLGAEAKGIISADRYAAYKALGENISVAYCWTHARRDFVKVRQGYTKLRSWADGWIARIAQLYRHNNERLKFESDSDAFALADRSLRESIEQLRQTRDGELAQSDLHRAKRKVLQSMRNHWQGLTIFVDHPQIPMDNNEAERRLRSPVIGRKNYYGSGSIWSGALSAYLFTLIQTLLSNNINPKQFLLDYFDACATNGGRTPDNLDPFLPWNLSEERKNKWQYKELPP